MRIQGRCLAKKGFKISDKPMVINKAAPKIVQAESAAIPNGLAYKIAKKANVKTVPEMEK